MLGWLRAQRDPQDTGRVRGGGLSYRAPPLAATAMHLEYSGQRVLLVLGTQTKHETNTRFFLDRDAGSELMPELGEFKTLRIQVKQRVPTSKSVMAWCPSGARQSTGCRSARAALGISRRWTTVATRECRR